MCGCSGALSDNSLGAATNRQSRNEREAMKSTAGKLAVAASAMVLLLGPARPAHAITDPIDVVTGAMKAAGESVRNSVSSLFGRAPRETVTAPTSPSDVLGTVSGTQHSGFWEYLKDAGYDMAEIDTSIGIIPDIKITFQLVRELSDADRDWLQQELEADALRRKGLTAKIQRRIVQTLLDASEFQDLRIGKLTIGILPLPSADFVVEPGNAPLSEEHDAIYRAVINKGIRKPSAKTNEDNR
jgi:hypothetical protein